MPPAPRSFGFFTRQNTRYYLESRFRAPCFFTFRFFRPPSGKPKLNPHFFHYTFFENTPKPLCPPLPTCLSPYFFLFSTTVFPLVYSGHAVVNTVVRLALQPQLFPIFSPTSEDHDPPTRFLPSRHVEQSESFQIFIGGGGIGESLAKATVTLLKTAPPVGLVHTRKLFEPMRTVPSLISAA